LYRGALNAAAFQPDQTRWSKFKCIVWRITFFLKSDPTS
jgi:hypothetical protein